MKAFFVAIVFSLALTPLAGAAEISRDEYVARVEPICKSNTEANARVLKGVRTQVANGELKPAAARFLKAANALDATLNRLSAVPEPVEDQSTLGKWLASLEEEVKLLREEARSLRAGNKRAAVRISTTLIRTANKANAEVIDFGFRYCKADPSQFA